MERRKKIALELSELVVYCRPVPFDEESKGRGPSGVGLGALAGRRKEEEHSVPLYGGWGSCLGGWALSAFSLFGPEIGTERACYRDMSSFPETKAEKYVNKAKGKKFLQYNRLQLSRIYPKGQRLDSSNYDPLPMWICGSQLVALNFQTPGEALLCGAGRGPVGCWAGVRCNPALPDKPMQMNQALFMAGGRCGYVLQPSTMRDEAFDPFDKSSLRGLEPYAVCIEVRAAHLGASGCRGSLCWDSCPESRLGGLCGGWGGGTGWFLSLRKAWPLSEVGGN